MTFHNITFIIREYVYEYISIRLQVGLLEENTVEVFHHCPLTS